MAWHDIAVHFSIHHSSTAIYHDLPFGDQTWQWIFHSSMGSMIPAIKPPFSWRCCLMFPMFLHISSICVPYVPMLNSHISYVLHIYFTMFSHTFFPDLICHRYVFPLFLAVFPPLIPGLPNTGHSRHLGRRPRARRIQQRTLPRRSAGDGWLGT